MKINEIILVERVRMPSGDSDDSPYQGASRQSTADKRLSTAAKYRAGTGQNISGNELINLLGREKASAVAGGGGSGIDPEDQRQAEIIKQAVKKGLSKKDVEAMIGQQIKGLDLDKEREVIRGKEDSISPAQNAADRRMAFRQGAVSQDNKKGYKKDSIGRTLRHDRYYGGKNAPEKPLADRAIDSVADNVRKATLDPELYGMEIADKIRSFGAQTFNK